MLKTFEATANVSPSGEVSLKLPPEIAPGKHRIIVVVDSVRSEKSKPVIKIKSFSKKKSIAQIFREQKVKPYKPSRIDESLSDPKLWEGFDEWLAEQRSEGRSRKRAKK